MYKVESNSENLSAIPQLRDIMQGQELLLAYRGVLSEAITQTFLSMTDQREEENTEGASKTKIFNVMVECMQNICNDTGTGGKDQLAIFMMGRQNTTLTLYSGSVVENRHVEQLEKLLNGVNKLSKEESKKMIDNIDVFGDLSKGSNAHIGLIDLANECGNGLQFNFEPVNDRHTYFSLRTSINES